MPALTMKDPPDPPVPQQRRSSKSKFVAVPTRAAAGTAWTCLDLEDWLQAEIDITGNAQAVPQHKAAMH